MGRSFGIVEYKVAEADFFLTKLEECTFTLSFFEARNYLSAFLSASRSITFVLKASLHDLKGFIDWYASKEEILKNSDLARYFLESRNLSQKVGFYPLNGFGSYTDEMGRDRIKYHFAATIEKNNTKIPQTDVYTACESYFILLLEIIYDCYQTFGYDIDPDKYYTVENLQRLNLTVEDIEEQLGLSRGQTNVNNASVEQRMHVIRRSRSTQGVDDILINRLGKDRFGEPYS